MRSIATIAGVVLCAGMILGGCAHDDRDGSVNGSSGKGMSSGTDPMASQSKVDIIDVATGPGMQRVTTLVRAVQAAGLVETLKGPGPFTVFAPTNEAFAKLPAGTLDDLLKPENKEKLRSILLYHVHAGDAVPAAKVRTMALSTANGKALNIVVKDGAVMVNDARVIKTDVIASNGVIHWIDTVLLP